MTLTVVFSCFIHFNKRPIIPLWLSLFAIRGPPCRSWLLSGLHKLFRQITCKSPPARCVVYTTSGVKRLQAGGQLISQCADKFLKNYSNPFGFSESNSLSPVAKKTAEGSYPRTGLPSWNMHAAGRSLGTICVMALRRRFLGRQWFQ